MKSFQLFSIDFFRNITCSLKLLFLAFFLLSNPCIATSEVIDGYSPGGEWGGNGGNWTNHPSSWNDHGGYYNDKTSRNNYDETLIYNSSQSQQQPYPYMNYSNIYYPFGSYTNSYYPYGTTFGNSYYSSYRPYYTNPYTYSYSYNNYTYPTYANYVYPSYPYTGRYYRNDSSYNGRYVRRR